MKTPLHLPNRTVILNPRGHKVMSQGVKALHTKNPFHYLSGSIASSHQRKLAKSPKPKKL